MLGAFDFVSVPVRSALVGLAFLVACVPAGDQLEGAQIDPGARSCAGRGGDNCLFRNAPVQLGTRPVQIASRAGVRFFPITQPLNFVDGYRRTWTAGRDVLTDGASIPPVFIPTVGSPRSPEFINAAALHDAYCGIGNEQRPEYHSRTWESVHRMFYDALVVGGTPRKKAQVMFAAVWLGGPRWNRYDRNFDLVPADLKIAALNATEDYIALNSVSMPELLAFLYTQERIMIDAALLRINTGGVGAAAIETPAAPAAPGGPNNGVTGGFTGGFAAGGN